MIITVLELKNGIPAAASLSVASVAALSDGHTVIQSDSQAVRDRIDLVVIISLHWSTAIGRTL
jgi:hypothetical protein